jgi:cobalt-zinc-cadmium efflux system outer membrane protein
MVMPEANDRIEAVLENSVDHKRQIASVNQAKSIIDLEKANAVPDPSFNVGIRELRQNNDQALVVGFSVPLPVFNINGGNIAKARAEAVKADADRRGLLLDKRDKFNDYTQQLESSYVAASAIKNEVLPQAEEAFSQARSGYNAGKFAYLEVLDAQRTLSRKPSSPISNPCSNTRSAMLELERLTAQAERPAIGEKQCEINLSALCLDRCVIGRVHRLQLLCRKRP